MILVLTGVAQAAEQLRWLEVRLQAAVMNPKLLNVG